MFLSALLVNCNHLNFLIANSYGNAKQQQEQKQNETNNNYYFPPHTRQEMEQSLDKMMVEKGDDDNTQTFLTVGLIGFLAFYSLLHDLGKLDFIRKYQRRILRTVRGFLIDQFGFVHINREPLDVKQWEHQPGWALLPLCYCLFLPGLALAHVSSGGSYLAIQIAVLGGIFAYLVMTETIHIRGILRFMRLLTVHKFVMLFLNMSMDDYILRRAIFTRALTVFLFFDAFDETFVHVTIFSLLAYIHPQDLSYMVPVRIYVAFIVPTEILGVREWILSHDLAKRSSLAVGGLKVILSMSSVTITIFFAYSSGMDAGVSAADAFYYTLAVLHGVITVICATVPDAIDMVIMPSYLKVQAVVEKQSLFQRIVSRDFNLERGRIFAFTLQAIVLLILFINPDNVVLAAILSTARLVVLSLSKQRFSQIQKDSGLLRMAVSALFGCKMRPILTFSSFLEIAVSHLACAARERLAEIVAKQETAQGFLDHALKQKFSAVGSSLEQILEAHSRGKDFSPEICHLISQSLRECRAGHDRCHLANVGRAIISGRYRSMETESTIAMMIERWRTAKMVQDKLILNVNGDEQQKVLLRQVPIHLDWDLMRLLVSVWSTDVGQLTITAKCKNLTSTKAGEDCSDRIEISFKKVDASRKLRYANIGVRHYIAHELGGGYFIGDEELRVYGKVKLQQQQQQFKDGLLSKSEKIPNISKETTIPPGLVFAVLDDNNLVRMSVMRSLMASPVSCDKTSFAWGSTPKECLDFAKELLKRNVDVAIFDQNLDYEENNQDLRLKGTELAKMARKEGYKGAVVLHSANEYLLSIHDADAFDGFIAKTASKRELLEGINRAWNAHLRHRAAGALAEKS